MQQLMLLHALTAEHQGALLNQVCYEIRGPLRADHFRRAWEALVARHPALRTAFLWEGLPHPLQAVRGHVALPFRTVELGDAREDERHRRLEELRREDAGPMPLGRAPLMRCTLARLADDRHHFVWSIHHLVVDRWSHGILFSELGALYGALARGEDARLPPVRGFREYVAWLAGREPQAAERFWREELRGFREPTLLAAGSVRLTTADRRTTRRHVAAATASALRSRAAQWRTTLGALILSAVGVAFARRFGRDDVLHGLTVSGRPPDLDGAESIAGSFVNNVPARLRVDRARPLADWVRLVQRDQARRQPFEHVSLRDVREWAEVPYPRPLFDTLVLLNLSDAPEAAWPELDVRLVSATLDAGYPLVLAAAADGASLVLSLVHDASFDGAPAVLAELSDALDAIAAAPAGAQVGDLVPEPAARPAAPPPVAPARDGAAAPAPDAVAADAVTADAVTADAVLRLWRDVLGADVGLDDDFFALGGTSLQALELFVRLERLLGRTMPLSTLFGAGSVRGLLAELGRPVGPVGSLVRIRSGGTLVPVVAVPGVGGDAVSLAGLARALGADQPFVALQSPGLDGREVPLTSIEATADHFVEQLRPALDGRPFHLLGLCWGAAVAFEMARRLRSAGRAPLSLALIDPSVLLRRSDAGAVNAEAAFLLGRLELYWSELRDADWRQRGQLLAGKVRRVADVIAGSEAREQSQAELNRFRVQKANKDAIARYRPECYRGRVTLFLSSGWDFGGGEDPRLEWLPLVEPAPDVVYVPGVNAGDVISPANLRGFAATLRGWLAAAAEPAVPG
jgi:thioesterase domain-containing protein